LPEAKEKVVLKRTIFEKVLNLVALAAFLVIIIYIIAIWTELPVRIPNHYNGAGEVDGWGGKGSLLIPIIIGILIWFGISVLERFPQIHNYPVKVTEENRRRLMHNSVMMLSVTKNIILLYLSYMTWRTVQDAYGHPSLYAEWDLPIFLVVLVSPMAYFIYRSFKLR